MKVYLSGDMSHTIDFKKDFSNAEKKLTENNYDVFNPSKNPEGLTREDYMKIDLEAVTQCDAIYFVNFVGNSKGCLIEKIVADACGLIQLN